MVKEKMAPTNFRTYEAQARLLAAVIATTNCKLDFKAIADHIGAGVTPSSVDHRLRPMKQLAKLQKQCLNEGSDPGELPIEKNEIQKLFGESTPAGLEFHFREVKATGRAQQAAVNDGSDPRNVRVGTQRGAQKSAGQNSAPTTPAASRKRNAATKTAANTTGNRNRKRPLDAFAAAAADDPDSGELDYDAPDGGEPETPSRRPGAHRGAAPAHDHASAAGGGGGGGGGSSMSTLDIEFPAAKRAHAGPATQQQPEARQLFSGSADMAAPGGMFNSYGTAGASFTNPPPSASFHQLTDGAAEYDNDDDDDLVEIEAPQFSFSVSQSRRVGGGGGGDGSQLPSSVMSKSDLFARTGVFDDSDSAAGLDLTQNSSGVMAHDNSSGMIEEA